MGGISDDVIEDLAEIEAFKTANEANYKKRYPNNADRFKMLQKLKLQAELEFEKKQYDACMRAENPRDPMQKVQMDQKNTTLHAFYNFKMRGEIPVPVGFAQKRSFWKLIGYVSIISAFIGLVSSIFITISVSLPYIWYSCDFENDITCAWSSEGYFIRFVSIGGITGLCIGLIRWYNDYKMNTPILFWEISQAEGHFESGMVTWLTNGMTMACGAVLGPEMGLSAFAAGLAAKVSEYIDFDDQDDAKLMVLAGVAAAVASLVPTPVIAPLLILEIGPPKMDKTYIEIVTVLTLASYIAWSIYQPIAPPNNLKNGFTLGYTWHFQYSDIFAGFIFGLISGVITLVSIAIRSLCRHIFVRLRWKLAPRSKLLSEIAPITLAGLLVGLLNYLTPLVIGPGMRCNRYLFKFATHQDALPLTILIFSFFNKMISMCICMTSGFRGGPFLALVFIGSCAGAMVCRLVPSLPLGLVMGCFMAGVPSGITACPLFWTCLVSVIFALDWAQITPILLAAITAHISASGLGGVYHIHHDFSPTPPVVPNLREISMRTRTVSSGRANGKSDYIGGYGYGSNPNYMEVDTEKSEISVKY